MTLLRVFHYHHRSGVQPKGRTIPDGEEYIELLTKGRGWILNEDEWIEVGPGTLLWHRPGDSTIQRSDLNNPYSCLVVHFRTKVPTHTSIPRISRWNDLTDIRQLTEESVQLFIDDDFDNGVLLQYLYARFAFQAHRYQWSQRRSDLPAPLKRVVAEIESQYTRELPIQYLAQIAGWSIPYLHDQFRQHLKQTPHQFLLSCRINAAKIQMVSTTRPLKQIAIECGFSSAASYSTTFRKFTGLSPARYRIENQYNQPVT